MTLAPLSQQCARIIALQQQLTEAIDDSECQWGEAVGCVGFALAVLIDMQEDDAVRVAMAQRVAEHLVSGAWTRIIRRTGEDAIMSVYGREQTPQYAERPAAGNGRAPGMDINSVLRAVQRNGKRDCPHSAHPSGRSKRDVS